MKPTNRKEVFMNALATGEAPGIEPTTREEMYLSQMAQNMGGGSGGGGIVLNCKYSASDESISEQPVYDFEELKSAILSGAHVVIVAVETKYNIIHLFVPVEIDSNYIRFCYDGMNMHLVSDNRATLTY